VVNLTNRALDPAAIAILSKGLNYAQTTSLKSNLKDVISGVERAIQHLSMETAEEIRQETSQILRHSRPQKRNTSQAERNALLALQNDKDIAILPTDKGNVAVVLLSEDYHNKIKTLLSDPEYTKLTMDPTSKTERQTTSLIKKSDIPEVVAKKLIPHASAPPRLYRLPKIHKKDVPLRPIVNCIASPTYALAKYLAGLLSPFVGQSDHHIKNSEMFVQNLQSINLQETDILVRSDVLSLEDTMQLLSQHLHK
jgi:hypothetical protein